MPEDSDEAKKWPRWQPPAKGETQPAEAPGNASASSSAAASSSATPKPTKRPGPRKSKTLLAPLPGAQKTKKLTTLDKSAMDWRAHVEGDSSQPMKEELEANRRGGGYLEKVEFLQRVGARKEEVLDANKGKRRR